MNTTKTVHKINEYQVTKIKKYGWFPMKSNIGDILDNNELFSILKCDSRNYDDCFVIVPFYEPIIIEYWVNSNWCWGGFTGMMLNIPREPCGIGGFWSKLQIKKRTIFSRVSQNAKNGTFFNFKTQKIIFFLLNSPHYVNYSSIFGNNTPILFLFQKISKIFGL